MASSSSPPSSSSSSYRSYEYDVFLSFRGEDTRNTFVDHLYHALERRLIRTYKDDITLPRGESVGPTLLKAIEQSRLAVIIFSKNYANSSWCLDELVHIMNCRDDKGQIIMPVFYDVDPSDVRNQKRKFGEAFATQEMKNLTKMETWRKALVDASNISGWKPKNVANGREAAVIQKIVDAISDKLHSTNSDIDEELVGMRARVKDLIPRLEIGTGGVRMVGIWGVGGGGKTTLATSVYMKINDRFQGHCIVDNIREESSISGLKTLQGNILKDVLGKEVRVQSVEQGKHMIKSMLSHSNVLILLDDVDDYKQLEALAGSHSWFGDGSRVIITTRNENLLQKVDYVSPVRLLSQAECIRLFKKCAHNNKKPLKNYREFSLRVVSYAAGLPLALTVLGSFLYDKDEKEWMSTLDRLKDIPESEIVEKLKISYDGLKKVEKELFLDIACFLRRTRKDDAMEILKASGFHPDIGIKVLRQKSLITIRRGIFDMHDLVQEMGHYLVRVEHPNYPGKDSRLWNIEKINNMCLGDSTMENDKAGVRYPPNFDQPPLIYLMMIRKRWLIVKSSRTEAPKSFSTNSQYSYWYGYRGCRTEAPKVLSNNMHYIDWYGYPASWFPDSFQPTNLVVLKMDQGLQRKLWKGRKHLPHLKVLQLHHMDFLIRTPDFDGLPSLQELTITECHKLKVIHPSLANLKSLKYIWVDCSNLEKFPAIDQMKNLEILYFRSCHRTDNFEIPEIQSDIENLVELFLLGYKMQVFLSSVAVHCPNLISLQAKAYDDPFSSIEFHGTLSGIFTPGLRKLDLSRSGSNHYSKLDFSCLKLTMLVHLDLSYCCWLEKLPEFPPSLVIFVANACNITEIGDVNRTCKRLCQVSVRNGGILTDGDRLLQSMFQAIENHSLVLLLEGLQIPRMFRSGLRDGWKCTFQLPQNWCNDFCGFFMCAVLNGGVRVESRMITMKKVSDLTGIDFQDNVVWKESVDDKRTWVGYVSFGSLRRNASWLDETCNAVSFSISVPAKYGVYRGDMCRGFGASLVRRTSGSGPTDSSPPEYESHIRKRKYDFKPKFLTKDDLTCTFQIPSVFLDDDNNISDTNISGFV